MAERVWSSFLPLCPSAVPFRSLGDVHLSSSNAWLEPFTWWKQRVQQGGNPNSAVGVSKFNQCLFCILKCLENILRGPTAKIKSLIEMQTCARSQLQGLASGWKGNSTEAVTLFPSACPCSGRGHLSGIPAGTPRVAKSSLVAGTVARRDACPSHTLHVLESTGRHHAWA
jgi:hypothetical protein